MEHREHLGLRPSALVTVKLFGVATFRRLRDRLVLEERIKLDGAPSRFEHAQAQVRILVVAPAPSKRRIRPNEIARVYPCIEYVRLLVGVIFASKGVVIRPSHSHVREPIRKILHRVKDARRGDNVLAVPVEPVESPDVVIHHPMPRGTLSFRKIPSKVARWARACALRSAEPIASVVSGLILRR